MTFNSIALTWAIPVDAAELGARMESYVETKASIRIFRLCVQHAQPGAPLGRLSPELINMIATEVQDAVFTKQLKTWRGNIRCCASMCRPSEHLDEESRESLTEDFLAVGGEQELPEDSDCDCSDYGCAHTFDGYLADLGEGRDEHMEAVEIFLEAVEDNSYIESSSMFAKCRKVIAEDFGLEVYFTAFRNFEMLSGWADTPATMIFGYLILPSMHSTLRTSSGSDMVSYLSSVIVDPSILQPNHQDLFKVAMRTLQLEPVLLGQLYSGSVPTSEPLPAAHGHSWYCSRSVKNLDGAAKFAASKAWPKLMILGSGCCIAEED